MDHIAIDLGGRESQVCVRSADGQITEERRVKTAELGEYLARRTPGRVVMETCSESFGLAGAALRAGHEVRVVPATLVRSLGVGARRTKTDRRDSQVLSEVSCRIDLPTVHIPSEASREHKRMLATHDVLVRARTSLSNSVRGWLRTQLVPRPRGKGVCLPQRVRAMFGAALPADVEAVLCSVEHLTTQLREGYKAIRRTANGDEICRRLMTVPGVGPITALRFRATIDDVSRFRSAHAVESYLGLVPGENSSSDRVQRLSITKAGSSAMRWNLVQAAHAARCVRGEHPMVAWSYEVEKRRGRRVAIVALARKIAGVLYAIWRDGSTYAVTSSAPPTET
jgi:transposase